MYKLRSFFSRGSYDPLTQHKGQARKRAAKQTRVFHHSLVRESPSSSSGRLGSLKRPNLPLPPAQHMPYISVSQIGSALGDHNNSLRICTYIYIYFSRHTFSCPTRTHTYTHARTCTCLVSNSQSYAPTGYQVYTLDCRGA